MTAATTDGTIATIRHGYELFAQQDMEGFTALLDPDIEWTIPGPAGLDGVYRGPASVVGDFFARLPYEDLEVRPESFLADGDRVIVLGRHTGRGPGGEFEVGFAHAWHVGADGKLDSFYEYTDTEKLAQVLA